MTSNEPHFQGHFPNHPIMPGVTIIEAMAQTAAVVVGISMNVIDEEMQTYFMGIDNCKFRRMVVPGDVLMLDVQMKRLIRNMGWYYGEAKVNGEVVASAEVMCAGAKG